jgi:hypothetical protein
MSKFFAFLFLLPATLSSYLLELPSVDLDLKL